VDWHLVWAFAMETPGKIVWLILVLSMAAACCIYFCYNRGVIISVVNFVAMFAAGLFGHAYFSINGIFFSYGVSQTEIIGATVSMTACFVISVFVVRIITDAIYSHTYNPPQKAQDRVSPRRRF